MGYDYPDPEALLKEIIVIHEDDPHHTQFQLSAGEYRLWWSLDLIEWVIERV